MSNTIVWEILNMEAIIFHGEQSNVVQNIIWQATAYGPGGEFATHYGNQHFDTVNADYTNFIEWDNLEEETVVGWLMDALDDVDETGLTVREKIELDLDRMIEEGLKIDVRTGLPWR